MMKSMKFLNIKILMYTILLLFIGSRWFIYQNPPPYYSDVKADYERYANMWRYGTPPYLKHLYEYPPATIPLLSIPLSLDQAGIGKYYPNYRAEILVIDCLFFAYLCFITARIPWLKNRRIESLLFYIVLTTLAKDFFYEGIDLAFTACATISFTLMYFMPKEKQSTKGIALETLIWIFFWLSVSIKFLTLPLMVPLFLLLHRGKWIQQLGTFFIGFLIIWGIPLAMYRSSLQVMFVFNNSRPIKYASFPAHLIRWANSFTHSEQQRMVAPDFAYEGPLSTKITSINKTVFPFIILATIWSMGLYLYRKMTSDKKIDLQTIQQFILTPKDLNNNSKVSVMLWFYVLYIFILFVSAKIFSQPFHIWYMAPIIILPFRKKNVWYLSIGLCVLMILLDMTTLLHIKDNFLLFGNVEIALIRDTFRFIPMFIFLILGLKEVKSLTQKTTHTPQ